MPPKSSCGYFAFQIKWEFSMKAHSLDCKCSVTAVTVLVSVASRRSLTGDGDHRVAIGDYGDSSTRHGVCKATCSCRTGVQMEFPGAIERESHLPTGLPSHPSCRESPSRGGRGPRHQTRGRACSPYLADGCVRHSHEPPLRLPTGVPLAVNPSFPVLAMDAGGSVGIPLPHGPTSLAAPGWNPDPSLRALTRTQ